MVKKAKKSERVTKLQGKQGAPCKACGKDLGSKYALKNHQGYCRESIYSHQNPERFYVNGRRV